MSHGEHPSSEEISTVRCDTTAGPFAIKLIRSWSPNGYDRAVELFDRGFYDNSHFFRVVPGFLVQFGMSYTNSQDLREIAKETIPDDPKASPPVSFEEGTVSFAGGGKDSRTSQLFISYSKSRSLGTQMWETPIGEVIEGMQNVHNFYSGYGDMPPWGKGPQQHRIHMEGRRYIDKDFPLLDRFLHCKVHAGGPENSTHDEDAKLENSLPLGKGGTIETAGADSVHHKLNFAGGNFQGKSAYRDHHLSAQRQQETDWFAFFGGALVVLLALLSIYLSNTSNKKDAKKI
eukprot:CAMPEP_0183300898 /NCGR_PEP_ID=MMETSP0160_2-20130417/7173_1 /TAXON_ID=2839 ORGANISM="Odontella Sinensis, Strain Grunow 1884" /NCGR_SAMPLE_ID=MMETSP0160_2 /ASSEMBLY_ACC=CAM_ASM_000250 /LENGTH=287 /DNA_ID=CAMNT_0025463399 /DNA_START=20 /DNA_END=883 /DNA_ORIENTATION=+